MTGHVHVPLPYPLCWPEGYDRTPKIQRKSDQFRMQIDNARKELMTEVKLFGGRDCIVSSDWAAFQEGVPSDPGIAVWFKWKGQWRCIACDTFHRFVANMLAVARTINALRTMERYGTQMLDQLMVGVQAALPAPEESWWTVLGVPPNATKGQVETAYRDLSRSSHPDHGGSHDAQARLNAAYERAKKALEAQS